MDYKPVLLTGTTRLSEIYLLRVEAWQEFDKITKATFPNGFSDELDEDGMHWVIIIEEKIIAAARLNLLNTPGQLPYPGTFKRIISFTDTFFFYSRLVVHPSYRGNNFSTLLDHARVDFIRQQYKISLTIATAGARRAEKLQQYGFNVLDKVRSFDDYKSLDSFDTFIIQMKNE